MFIINGIVHVVFVCPDCAFCLISAFSSLILEGDKPGQGQAFVVELDLASAAW